MEGRHFKPLCYTLGAEPKKDNGVSEACGGRAPFALWLGGLFSHAQRLGPPSPLPVTAAFQCKWAE